MWAWRNSTPSRLPPAWRANGMRPVVSIYSTFLQRGYDQIIHDVQFAASQTCCFAVDRAGLVPGDGETHQGIYDAAFFSQLEQFSESFLPANYAELRILAGTAPVWKTARVRCVTRAARRTTALAALGCSGLRIRRVSCGRSRGCGARDLSGATGYRKRWRPRNWPRSKAFAWMCTRLYSDTSSAAAGFVMRSAGYRSILFAEEGVRGGGIGEHLAAALLGARLQRVLSAYRRAEQRADACFCGRNLRRPLWVGCGVPGSSYYEARRRQVKIRSGSISLPKRPGTEPGACKSAHHGRHCVCG